MQKKPCLGLAENSMQIEIRDKFFDIMNSLEEMIVSGYVQRQNEICNLSKSLTEDDLVLRFFLNNSLDNLEYRQLVGAQSFLLYANEIFGVRLNMWFPSDQRTSQNNVEELRQYFSYDNMN